MSVVLPNHTSVCAVGGPLLIKVGQREGQGVWNQTLNLFSSKLLQLNLELFTNTKNFGNFQTQN